LFVPLFILALYDNRVGEHAEWHWASGITTLHVIPSLKTAFTSASGFMLKLTQFREVLGMLRDTMLGTVATLLAVAGFVALPWTQSRCKSVLWGWLIGGILYTYVVVTVERVDYYMYLLLPLCALAIGALASRFVDWAMQTDAPRAARYAIVSLLPILAIACTAQSLAAIAPYYSYNKQAYRNAVFLSHALTPNALVVMGHYGPDVLYYIDRYGWEEDPALWTPFDEESAIRKGARYYISIEDNRLRANMNLCAYLQRFPVLNPNAEWIVYNTDPARQLRGSLTRWREFRVAEAVGLGRAFLDRTAPQCRLHR